MFAGFTLTLCIRLLGGEGLLGWNAAVGFPWYDAESNTQYFPYKTIAMLLGLATMLSVSRLTEWLMLNNKLDIKWLRCINNRVGELIPAEDDSRVDSDDSDDGDIKLRLMNGDGVVIEENDDIDKKL